MTQLIGIIMTAFGLLVFMAWYFRREIVRERKREDELEEMAYIAYVSGWIDGCNDVDTDFSQEYPGIRERFEESMKNGEGKVK